MWVLSFWWITIKGITIIFLLDRLDGSGEQELCCPCWIGWIEVVLVSDMEISRG